MRRSATAGDAVCLIDGCRTPVAFGTASSMCLPHWHFVSSRIRWKIWDEADQLLDIRKHSTEAIDHWRLKAVDEVNQALQKERP